MHIGVIVIKSSECKFSGIESATSGLTACVDTSMIQQVTMCLGILTIGMSFGNTRTQIHSQCFTRASIAWYVG